MGWIFAIGVPIQLRARLEKSATSQGHKITSVLCVAGKEGSFRLVPHPGAAIHQLRGYYENEAFRDSYNNARVIVFPYAEVPTEVDDELYALEDLGVRVDFIEPGRNGWPKHPKNRHARDNHFYDAIFNAAVTSLFGSQEQSASETFLSITAKCPKVIVVQGAIQRCDEVARHRVPFIREAALAFVEFAEKNGSTGRIDAFFRDKGIEHAQTGGIQTSLTVYRGESCVYSEVCTTHLKKGDKTTPQSAVRIYYHAFSVDREHYIAVTYAGPHPEHDISCEHTLEP